MDARTVRGIFAGLVGFSLLLVMVLYIVARV